MKIVEESCPVTAGNEIILSQEIADELCLKPGDSVLVAYIPDSDSKELLLSKDGLFHIEPTRQQTIAIPNELLEQSSIMAGNDLNIACFEGAILIYEPSAHSPEYLLELLNALRAANGETI